MTRKRIGLGLLIGSTCLALYLLARGLTVSRLAQAQVSVVPFTIEQWTFGSDGKLTESRTTARRSDGSEAMISHPPGVAPMRHILNPDGSMESFFGSQPC